MILIRQLLAISSVVFVFTSLRFIHFLDKACFYLLCNFSLFFNLYLLFCFFYQLLIKVILSQRQLISCCKMRDLLEALDIQLKLFELLSTQVIWICCVAKVEHILPLWFSIKNLTLSLIRHCIDLIIQFVDLDVLLGEFVDEQFVIFTHF